MVEIHNQAEFISHSILLGYENRGQQHNERAYILAPPDTPAVLPLMSVGPANVLFLSTAMAGTFYDYQEAYNFLWGAAAHRH